MDQQSNAVPTENQVDEAASRWARLGAAFIDSVIISIATIPCLYLLGGFDNLNQDPPAAAPLYMQLLGAAIAIAFYAAINWYGLQKSGQSVGKRVFKIQIVNIDGSPASRNDIILKRYSPYLLCSYIPIIGFILSITNVAFIFNPQRRCIHDLIAKTKVIKCPQSPSIVA